MNIVVTGASSGIGKEVVLRFSSIPENRIVAASRNFEALKALSEASENANITPVHFDITGGRNAVRELRKRTEQDFNKIDIIVNCAGLLVNKPFEEISDDEIDSLIAVNFTGIASVIRELLPSLGKGSHVVNISSMGGYQGSAKYPGLSFYSAAKGALAILTECLASEYAERGIVFNCLCPGAVDTEMFKLAFPGKVAPVSARDMAGFICEFAISGVRLFNGRILPVALSTP